MAVTIGEMQVDVQQNVPVAQPPAVAEAPKSPINYRKELQILAERALRLRAD